MGRVITGVVGGVVNGVVMGEEVAGRWGVGGSGSGNEWWGGTQGLGGLIILVYTAGVRKRPNPFGWGGSKHDEKNVALLLISRALSPII